MMMTLTSHHTFWTATQMIAFTLLTFFVTLEQNEFSYLFFGALVTIASFFRLMFDTCKTYPINGRWIILNFCMVCDSVYLTFVTCSLTRSQVGMFQFIMSELTKTCDRGSNIVQKIMVLHCSMLFMRVLFDANRIGEMNLELPP